MSRRTAIIILSLILVVLAVASYAAATGSNLLSQLENGQRVDCNVGVNAALLTGKLGITSTTSCRPSGACFVSPVHGFSVLGWLTGTDVNGQVLMLQSGTVYDSTSVTANQFGSSQNVMVGACLPKSATAVEIRTMNTQGGVDDDKAFTI